MIYSHALIEYAGPIHAELTAGDIGVAIMLPGDHVYQMIWAKTERELSKNWSVDFRDAKTIRESEHHKFEPIIMAHANAYKTAPDCALPAPPSTANAKNKYLRTFVSAVKPKTATIQGDVYTVLKAFKVHCPARQHAIKKLLCSGQRGKGDTLQDLREAHGAVARAIQLEEDDATLALIEGKE